MPAPKVPRHLQAWFDQLAQAAGEIALEHLRGLMQGQDLRGLLGGASAPRPAERADTRRGSAFAEACGVLGVALDAPRVVVDAAYRVQASAVHPDRFPRASHTRETGNAFRRVTEARDLIYQTRGWR